MVRVKLPLSAPLLVLLSSTMPGRVGEAGEEVARVLCSSDSAAQPTGLKAPEAEGKNDEKGAGALCTEPLPMEACSMAWESIGMGEMGVPAGSASVKAKAAALAVHKPVRVASNGCVSAAWNKANRALLAVLQVPEREGSAGEAPVPATSSSVRSASLPVAKLGVVAPGSMASVSVSSQPRSKEGVKGVTKATPVVGVVASVPPMGGAWEKSSGELEVGRGRLRGTAAPASTRRLPPAGRDWENGTGQGAGTVPTALASVYQEAARESCTEAR